MYRVKIGHGKYNAKEIKAGIVQGSVLGPVLFNVYVQDIPKHPKTKIALSADDTAIYAQASIPDDREYKTHFQSLTKYFDKSLPLG